MCQSKHVNTEIKKLQYVSPKSDKRKEKRAGWGGREEAEADGKSNSEATFIQELRFSGLRFTPVWAIITFTGL